LGWPTEAADWPPRVCAPHRDGQIIGRFRADLVVEEKVLFELKSMRRPDPSFEAQTLNLLRSTRIEVGLLLYFNEKPAVERLIFTNDRKIPPRSRS
jgi:GxxExxY protein